MGYGPRTAALWAGITFCMVLLAMTASVVADLEIEQWNFGSLLMIGFIVGGVLIIGMILLALVSALRNPPGE